MPGAARSTLQRRMAFRGFIVACGFIVLKVVWIVISIAAIRSDYEPLELSAHQHMLAEFAWLTIFALWFVFHCVRWRIVWRRAKAADGLICPVCQYDHTAMADEIAGDPGFRIHCPECGLSASMGEFRKHWSLPGLPTKPS